MKKFEFLQLSADELDDMTDIMAHVYDAEWVSEYTDEEDVKDAVYNMYAADGTNLERANEYGADFRFHWDEEGADMFIFVREISN